MAAQSIQAHLMASSSGSSTNASGTPATRRRPEEAVMAIVRRLVRAPNPAAGLTARNRDGDTMLHACCKSGYAGCVSTLLREGSPHVEIDARTEGGFTPLAYAARGGFLDIVSALVAAGAETEILQQADARRFLPTDAVRRTLVREAVSVGAAAYRSALRETMMHGCEAPFSSMPEVLINLVIEYVLPPIGGGGGKRSSSADQREEDDGADDEVAVATAAVEGILGLDE